MSRFEAGCDPLLRPYVHSYWSVARDLAPMGGFTITPDRFLELVFFVDPPWIEEATGRRPLPACTLISLLSRPLQITAVGVVRCAAVRLHAWAAGILFPQSDTSAQPWYDMTASFADLVPAVSDALRREAKGEIIALFDQAMRQALAGARPASGALAAARAFAGPLDQAAGKTAGAVAVAQGRSRRQVERQVRSLTCRSPKRLTSLTRFQFVRDTLWARPDVELAMLAFDAGYADQAHLTRQFRQYAGQTPGEFIRHGAKLKAFVYAHDVANLQDGQAKVAEGANA